MNCKQTEFKFFLLIQSVVLMWNSKIIKFHSFVLQQINNIFISWICSLAGHFHYYYYCYKFLIQADFRICEINRALDLHYFVKTSNLISYFHSHKKGSLSAINSKRFLRNLHLVIISLQISLQWTPVRINIADTSRYDKPLCIQ